MSRAPRTVRAGAPTGVPATALAVLDERYETVRVFRTRGMEADLYQVRERGGGEQLVAKVYRPGIAPKPEVLERLARIDSRAIVRTREHGHDAGRAYEIQEYIPAGSLREWLDEHPVLEPDTVRAIVEQLCEGLGALHGAGIEHRDLKPANVLVRTREPVRIAIADFGIASVPQGDVHVTSTARTYRYTPPEAGGATVHDEHGRERSIAIVERTRLDSWSLGMTIVECLTGQHPFEGLAEPEIARRLSTGSSEDLVAFVPDGPWRELCRGLLQRDPRARWGTRDVARWLEAPRDAALNAPREPRATRAIEFAGQSCRTPRELAIAMASQWSGAREFWQRRAGDLQTWLADCVAQPGLARSVRAIEADPDLTPDGRILSCIRTLWPQAPLQAGTVRLDPDAVRATLARCIEDDPQALQTLDRIKRERLVEAAAKNGSHASRELARAWTLATHAAQGAIARIERHDLDWFAKTGTTPPPRPIDRTQVLVLVLGSALGLRQADTRLAVLAWDGEGDPRGAAQRYLEPRPDDPGACAAWLAELASMRSQHEHMALRERTWTVHIGARTRIRTWIFAGPCAATLAIAAAEVAMLQDAAPDPGLLWTATGTWVLALAGWGAGAGIAARRLIRRLADITSGSRTGPAELDTMRERAAELVRHARHTARRLALAAFITQLPLAAWLEWHTHQDPGASPPGQHVTSEHPADKTVR